MVRRDGSMFPKAVSRRIELVSVASARPFARIPLPSDMGPAQSAGEPGRGEITMRLSGRLLGWGALVALTAIAGPAFAQTAAEHAPAAAAATHAATALPFDP